MSKVFYFALPVSGTEYFTVDADSLEEAIEKLHYDSSKYKTDAEVDFDLGWGLNSRKMEEFCDNPDGE